MVVTFEAAVLKCLVQSWGMKEDVRGLLGT